MKKLGLALVLVVVSLVDSGHAGIVGTGIKLDVNGIETSAGTEFVGVNDHLLFTFSEHKLTVESNDGSVALWWLNFGKYTFSGLDDVTGIKLVDNEAFHGGILKPTFTNDSITFNMNNGWYGFDCDHDQHLTFDVDYDYHRAAPVPEPATMLLFGSGIAGLAGMTRRKK